MISVQPLTDEVRGRLAAGAATASFFPSAQRLDDVAARRDARLTTFAMELVPRISRAQSMDALTSQSMVAGYRAAIVAAGRLRKFFGLSMTAAGTVPPAQVVVLGAGVAGLQAIATCKRLGAVVKGYDVRAASAEEIRSLGATAIDLRLDTLEGAGGYAREMTADRAALQAERLAPYVAAADALITTAAVPGRTAPVLVSRAMVEAMAPGSVVVDLAADSGGNVEGSRPGEVVAMGAAQGLGRLRRPEPDARTREPALRPERAQPGHAAGPGRAVGARLRATRSSPRPASPTTVRSPTPPPPTSSTSKERPRERTRDLADDLRARRVRRGRGDLQGLLDPAHPPDVGGQRHPRRDPARRDPGSPGQPTRRRCWCSACWRWCSPRSTWREASWSPTGCCRCSAPCVRTAGRSARTTRPRDHHHPDLGPARLPAGRRLLRRRPQGPLVTAARPARQLDRRRGRGDRLRDGLLRPAAAARRVDPGRHRRRRGGGRGRGVPGADDPDAAAGGAVQRRGRRGPRRSSRWSSSPRRTRPLRPATRRSPSSPPRSPWPSARSRWPAR